MKKIILICFICFLSSTASASFCTTELAHVIDNLDPSGNYHRDNYLANLNATRAACSADGGTLRKHQLVAYSNTHYTCYKNCSCPQGQEGFSENVDGNGIPVYGCRPICDEGVLRDPNTQACLTSSSSSSSSSSCPAGQHWDFTVGGNPVEGSTCVPDTSASSSSSPPVSSSPSGSSASGSAGSAASSGSNTSSGNRDTNPSPTSPEELCQLNFGVDNCQAVSQETPCPNSYTANGQKFCVLISGSGSSSGSDSSSGSGGGGTSAPSNSATANNCSTQPTCTGDDPIQCAILRQSWINFCDGAENKTDINADSDNQAIAEVFDDLVNDNQTDLNSDGTISGTSGEIDISQYGDLIADLNNSASSPSSGTCPAPRALNMSIGTFELSYQPFCDLADSISFLVLLSFSIFGSLIIYRTVERI